MAVQLGDKSSAQKYKKKFLKAKAAFEVKLWNGTYFNYDSGSSGNSKLIQADQLAGQWYTAASGLPDLFEGSKIESSLRKIFDFNVIRKQNREEEIQEIVRVSTSSSNPLRGKKVLVAEDDSLQQIIATKFLLKLGVNFEMCRNGKEALPMVSKGLNDQRNLGASHILPFEYIFMDCQELVYNA
ncbi:hypothetical protein L2E82_45922 [Cichorium intybus]|uniref:Uncharacterized protein n=1 Tax=Cichorium intybus TaxID=13427 RepID=A0ACB8ZU73_CICIN|nr:hypothetical protein L2E82_45922 [Cichorium intybus]